MELSVWLHLWLVPMYVYSCSASFSYFDFTFLCSIYSINASVAFVYIQSYGFLKLRISSVCILFLWYSL